MTREMAQSILTFFCATLNKDRIPKIVIYEHEHCPLAASSERRNEIVLSTNLIRRDDVDAIAGIIAHELGHIVNHDSLKLLFPHLHDPHTAEFNADSFATGLMIRCNFNPFKYADAMEFWPPVDVRDVPSDSHPPCRERAKRIREQAQKVLDSRAKV